MKNAVVTGASGDIGKAISKKLADAGYAVVLSYNENKKAAEDTASEITAKGGRAICIKADIREEADVEELFSKTESEFGSIDVLVNNAGISSFGLITDMKLADWNNVLSINLTSAFLCSKRALNSMLKKKSGNIISISSIWGEVGSSCEVAYSAAKAGLIGFTKALAKEEGPSGVRVNAIAPGIIDTKMNDALSDADKESFCSDVVLGRMGKTDEVADAVMFLINNEYMTGQIISLNGGI